MNKNPEVKCLHTAVWPIEQFKENPRNPNQHPEHQLKLLGQVIRSSGWRSPIVVSGKSGLVVKGHGRLAAAKLEGLTEAPVEIQEYLTDSEELADMIADNRIADLAETDEFMLAKTLSEIPADDRMKTGYTEEEFQAMCGEDVVIEPKKKKQEGDTTPLFRFGKHICAMSPQETEAIEEHAEAYRLDQGTHWGWIRSLLKLNA